MSARPKVNDLYQPGRPTVPAPKASDSCQRPPCSCDGTSEAAVLAKHKDPWTPEQVLEATKKNVLFTWGPTDAMRDGALQLAKGDGCYVVDHNGKKYMDFNSMAMCSHLGHTIPESIMEAVIKQMRDLPYVYPGVGVAPIRAQLSSLLADIVPGDINTFFFPSGGAESNECALRIARMYTGRHKVISRYRSYHGSTLGAISMTGDQRRWAGEAGATGHIHVFDPFPYSFSWGESDEEITQRNMDYLRETIHYEGPHTIAAIYLESITGTNGILKPPKGYLEGVRAICDEFGIVMVCDEVMAGFGRTGKLFGFCHAPTVVPDIVTFAKGINAAFMPLGGVGLRDPLANHFRKNPITVGSTYNSHPTILASAHATIKYYLEHGIVPHVASMEKHLIAGLQRLIDNHPSVKQARAVGLFGAFDLQKNTKGDFIAEVTDPLPPAVLKFKKKLLEGGVFTMMRGHTIYANPPLIISEQQLKETFDIIDDALHIVDEAMEN